jgi:S1-C subfamily serine protease
MSDTTEQPEEANVGANLVVGEPETSVTPESISDSRVDVQRKTEREPSSLSMLFLMASILFLASWFVGPRLVEEYHYASAKGKLRAEYENAVEVLGQHPLKQVSMASQLVAHKVKPSVVSVRTKKLDEENELGRNGNGWGMNIMEGFGSGVIMSTDGYIVTNAHVIDNSEKIFVELHDRRTYMAVEVGRDVISDIAVLKIDVDGLIPAQWGDSEELDVGSIVWAVGSPYRYEQTVTSGIISAKDRPGDPQGRVKNLLQTDAAVNPGNSGGPLVDENGNVVGINTSIFGKTFQGISFAVPSETARFVYEQILDRGTVVRGFLGVRPKEVTHQNAVRLNLPDLEGALLRQVEPGSPADLAGLQRQDVIRSWNQKPIHSYNSLYRMAERSNPGSVVEVALIRNGEPRSATITIGEAPTPRSMFNIEVRE